MCIANDGFAFGGTYEPLTGGKDVNMVTKSMKFDETNGTIDDPESTMKLSESSDTVSGANGNVTATFNYRMSSKRTSEKVNIVIPKKEI